jgi:hypothetical protein
MVEGTVHADRNRIRGPVRKTVNKQETEDNKREIEDRRESYELL